MPMATILPASDYRLLSYVRRIRGCRLVEIIFSALGSPTPSLLLVLLSSFISVVGSVVPVYQYRLFSQETGPLVLDN